MEDELYTEYILALSKEPLNAGRIEHADVHVRETNPLCGDELDLMITLKEDVIADIKHFSRGCAISQAAISLLTEELKGKSIAHMQKMSKEDAIALLGIPISHTREQCALLCWRALQRISQ